MSLGKLASEGIWVSLGTIVSGALGYAFLIVMSKFVSAEILGSFGAVLALQTIMVGILNFGVQRGSQRFIGEAWGMRDYEKLWRYLSTSLIFSMIISISAALFIFFFSVFHISIANLNPSEQMFLPLLLIVAGGPPLVLFALFYSIQRTKILAISQILGSVVKIGIGIPLVIVWPSFESLIYAFVIGSILADLVLILQLVKFHKALGINPLERSFGRRVLLGMREFGLLLRASVASWVPEALRVLGETMGLLSIFALLGGISAGIYFVIFSITSIVYIIPSTILGIMMPMLSAMKDARKRTASRAIRMSMIIVAPMTMVLIIYAQPILDIIGQQYAEGYAILQMLLLGAVVASISRGYVTYLYVQNRFLHIAVIGAVISGTQLLCYALLIPAYGSTGAAISYSLGFFVSLIAVFLSSRITGFSVDWLGYGKIIGIPVLISVAAYALNLHWAIGAPLVLLVSLFAYTRLGLLSSRDLSEVLQGIVPNRLIAKLIPYSSPIVKILYGERR